MDEAKAGETDRQSEKERDCVTVWVFGACLTLENSASVGCMARPCHRSKATHKDRNGFQICLFNVIIITKGPEQQKEIISKNY